MDWALTTSSKFPIYFGLGTLLLGNSLGCSTMKSALSIGSSETVNPISNPFYTYKPSDHAEPNMVLRTKKGDRSVEIEIPAGSQNLSDFVLPVSPAFKDSSRGPASVSGGESALSIDDSYKARSASPSDHDITRSFSQGNVEDEGRRREIEQSLNLTASDDETPSEGTTSYLAAIDHIKQLYKNARFEVALLEADDLVRKYQTDPKLYEMRGTLLDRLGRRELALKAWIQALKLNPKNEALKRFIEQKQTVAAKGGGG